MIALSILAWLWCGTASAAPVKHRKYRPDRILIQPRAAASPERLEQLHAKHGAKVLRTLAHSDRLQVVQLPKGANPEAAAAEYQANGDIEMAEPDYLVHAADRPDDPSYVDGTLWNLHNTGQSGGVSHADIHAPEAWTALNSASNIIVAVVDSGVRYTHQDLAANMWRNPGENGADAFGRDKKANGQDDDADGFVDDVYGIDATRGTGDPQDDNGHGTHVAGILGAVGNNDLGIAGVAWRVQIMSCKFLDATGEGSMADAIECIDYARQKGAKVINASWGGTSYSSFLYSAIRRARDAGVIFVAAAGNEQNDNDSLTFYPAGYNLDNIVAVAATTRRDTLADYSNYGAKTVELAAPGSEIYSTFNTSDSSYALLSGTSMAAPHVTGAFALLRARFPSDTYHDSIQRLLASTDPLPGLAGKCVTGGRLDLQAALGVPPAADPATSGIAVLTKAELDSTGPVNGPFTPASQLYKIQNLSSGSLNWSVGQTQNWISVSPTGGTLGVGQSAIVTATLNSTANSLAAGSHSGTLNFQNLTSGIGNTNFPVALTVYRLATLTAQAPASTGQFQFRLSGEPGQSYLVQASSDLQNWIPIATNQVDATGVLQAIDPKDPAFPKRFYRALAIPPVQVRNAPQ